MPLVALVLVIAPVVAAQYGLYGLADALVLAGVIAAWRWGALSRRR